MESDANENRPPTTGRQRDAGRANAGDPLKRRQPNPAGGRPGLSQFWPKFPTWPFSRPVRSLRCNCDAHRPFLPTFLGSSEAAAAEYGSPRRRFGKLSMSPHK